MLQLIHENRCKKQANMGIKRAFANGVTVGAMFGMLGAVVSMLAGPPAFLAIIPTLAAGSILGAVVGGLISTSAHLMVDAVPGMRHIVGKPRTHDAATHYIDPSIAARRQRSAGVLNKLDRLDQIQDERASWQDRLESEFDRYSGRGM